MAEASTKSKAEQLVKLVVANGHSIDMPTGQKRPIGTDTVTGATITTGSTRKLRDGDAFEVDAAEAEYLLRVGAAVRPSDYTPRLPASNAGGLVEQNVQGPRY
jgi:hypothetical protein